MAPKKKKGGKAKKGAKKGGNKKESVDAPLSLQDENTLLKTQIESLKNELIFEKSRCSEAMSAMREFRSHYESLSSEFEEEKSKTFLITANMTRQYKLMRDDLLHKKHEMKKLLDEKCLEIEMLQNEKFICGCQAQFHPKI